jgi:Response regulator containing CheY-like receiver domain and AraC-type DNA-binding domain
MYRLIIVDDEVSIREGLASFDWLSLGFQVSATLTNGQEALDYVLTHPVDVALCDIRMDVMDGLEFSEEIKRRALALKIVLLTGFKDMDYISRAMHSGCYDYLLKPTKFSRLIAVFTDLKRILDEEWRERTARDAVYSESCDNDVIGYAKAFISSHLDTASLDSLSEYLGLSSVYVSRLFKAKAGMSFAEYYQTARHERALELLRIPENSIGQIAQMLGYSNATNFARAFKLISGESPTDYRTHLMLKNDSLC